MRGVILTYSSIAGGRRMKRREVPYTYGFEETMKIMRSGGLLLASTKRSGESNVMTIGWGTIGNVWRKPLFIVLVRPSRYTYEFIEDSGEFTVNVPSPDMDEFVAFCGSRSGREVDKFAAFNIATTPGHKVNSITIDACPIVYECKVVHKNDVVPAELAKDIVSMFYPEGDFHRVYFGEILGTYVHED